MNGLLPPLATRLEVYATPTSPVVAATQTRPTAGAIVIPHPLVVAVAPFASITLAVNVNVPAVVGIPVMAPVAAFKLSPVGRLPVAIEYVNAPVPPLATRLEVYATPTSPVVAAT